MADSQAAEVVIRRQGALGRVTLNRPKAINALTLAMLRAIRAALDGWCDDSGILAVAVEGAGERGLCAGGDIRAIYASIQAGDGMAESFWREEYALNAVIAAYPKPYAVLMDGLVMGGGVGLSAHGSHRFVTAHTTVAMPETSIGFFPDVGGTWLLSRATGQIGTYLGLTGARIGAPDAIACGLADRWIDAGQWPAIAEMLAGAATRKAAEAGLATIGNPSVVGAKLNSHRAEIDQAFSAATLEQIISALGQLGTPFATETVENLRSRAPMALKVTLAALRHARTLSSLVECLAIETRLARAMSQRSDFLEGIRAVVIDKDQAPRWSPATLEATTAESVQQIMHGTVEQSR